MDFMKRALSLIEGCRHKENVKVNRSKMMLIPFTRMKIIPNLSGIKFSGKTVSTSTNTVKYLGLW